MSIPLLFGLIAVFTFIAFSLAWLAQRMTSNAGYVDVCWTYCTGAAGIAFALLGPGAALPRWLLGIFVAFWALRLGTYVLLRVHGHEEEGRYVYLRDHFGSHAQAKLYAFFTSQTLIVLGLSLSFWAVSANPAAGLTLWLALGAVVCVASIVGEAVADRQLQRFRDDPSTAGKVCKRGLWRYSRHPNYFFEWLFWVGLAFLAIGSPVWYLGLVSPVMMGLFLFRITGIPYTEMQSLRSRGDAYREYQRETSKFFPAPPRNPDL